MKHNGRYWGQKQMSQRCRGTSCLTRCLERTNIISQTFNGRGPRATRRAVVDTLRHAETNTKYKARLKTKTTENVSKQDAELHD